MCVPDRGCAGTRPGMTGKSVCAYTTSVSRLAARVTPV